MRRALAGLAGVDRAAVDLESGQATVEASGEVSHQELIEAVRGKVILSGARGVLARLRGERP